jgi:hypothetical protein
MMDGDHNRCESLEPRTRARSSLFASQPQYLPEAMVVPHLLRDRQLVCSLPESLTEVSLEGEVHPREMLEPPRPLEGAWSHDLSQHVPRL